MNPGSSSQQENSSLGILPTAAPQRCGSSLAKAGTGRRRLRGQGNPLSLVQSSPAHGEQDVHLTGEIKLSFNKNVVHMTVCDDNKQCFALYAEDGIAVPVEVIMADDQMEPEKRRDIVLKPQQELAAGTAYTVKAPALRAKNGTTLGTEATVTFTTAGAAPAAATAPLLLPARLRAATRRHASKS